jgi:16S rRNA (cytosine1402-N4)-methyltransferase
MKEEVVRLLVTGPDDWICDATVGSGGHAAAILGFLGSKGRLIGLDRDPRALERARGALAGFGDRVILRAANFRDMVDVVLPLAPDGVDGVLLDLGVSSEQIDDPEAGFSFGSCGPLSMAMDPGRHPDAADLLNELPLPELVELLSELGDVRPARRVARAIVEARPLSTTADLAAAARRGGAGRPDELARVFQAVRIAVNDERGALAGALASLDRVLKPGGRVVVLAYHSGEDRVVKRFFSPPRTGKPLPWAPVEPERWELLTKGASKSSPAEVGRNSRSRSARLRAARRVG